MRKQLLCLLLAAGMIGISINAYAAEPAQMTDQNISGEEGELHRSANTVEINETNFPDEKFRQYILDEIDADKNGLLSGDELGITVIDIDSDYYLGYTDLKGIEFFQDLQELYCSGGTFNEKGDFVSAGELVSLDVSRNVALKELDCSDNKLETLDVSRNIALEKLDCSDNKLEILDVSKNAALKTISCENNGMKTLNVSQNTALNNLFCGYNQLKELNVSQNTSLWLLKCHNNQLTSLDVSQNTALVNLECSYNQLSSLDVSANMALYELGCSNNELKSLNVSKNSGLHYVDCRENHLACLNKHPDNKGYWRLDGNQIFFEGNQINLCEYDDNFDVTWVVVSELKDLNVDEDGVFTLAEGKRSGTYGYYNNADSDNSSYMEVTLNGSVEGPAPTPAPQPTSKPAPTPSKDWTFTDVPENPGNWKYENIKFVNERGVMTGVNTNQFRPDSFLTRGQFASVIYRIAGSPKTTYKNVFTDVPSGKWYSDAVIWAYENKIVAGLGDGRYGVDDDITREQMARMLMELAKVLGYDTTARADFDRFADASQVSRWAAENMRWAVGSGIINGSTKDGKYYLNPKGKATRAECATMLAQFIKKHE